MNLYNNLEQLGPYSLSKPFKDLFSIKWRADRMLQKREPGQWRAAAVVIQGWISEWVRRRVKEATEEFIHKRGEQLSEDGGWELGYLSRDPSQSSSPVTSGEIRHLLENWPIDANEQPDFPSESDFSDLDALSDILSSGKPYDDIEGFTLAQPAELYAVLALITVDAAARLLRVPEKKSDSGVLIYPGLHPWKTQNLIAAGNLLIEAMELICYAERELSDAQFAKMRIEQKVQLEAQIRAETRQENAKQGARARLAIDPKQRDKAKVREYWDDWQKRPIRYAGNAEFAREMLGKFESLKSQPVIERWCRDWKAASTKQAQ